MIESFTAAILGVCLTSFSWKVEDLDHCKEGLVAYDRKLVEYEEGILKREHRMYVSAQYHKMLAKEQVDLSIKDPAQLDTVVELVQLATEERARYDQMHVQSQLEYSDVERLRRCLQDLISRIGKLRDSALESEPSNEQIELPNELVDLFESINGIDSKNVDMSSE